MFNIKALKQARAEITEEARSFLAHLNAKDEDPTDEEISRVEKFQSDVQDLDRRISKAEELLDAERLMQPLGDPVVQSMTTAKVPGRRANTTASGRVGWAAAAWPRAGI